MVAAVLAWSIVDRYFAGSEPIAHLAVGGAVLAAAYAAMAECFGMGLVLAPWRA
jgi:hypothetical protein